MRASCMKHCLAQSLSIRATSSPSRHTMEASPSPQKPFARLQDSISDLIHRFRTDGETLASAIKKVEKFVSQFEAEVEKESDIPLRKRFLQAARITRNDLDKLKHMPTKSLPFLNGDAKSRARGHQETMRKTQTEFKAESEAIRNRVAAMREFEKAKNPAPNLDAHRQENAELENLEFELADISRSLSSSDPENHKTARTALTAILEKRVKTVANIVACDTSEAFQILDHVEDIIPRIPSIQRQRLLRFASDLAEGSRQMPSNSVLSESQIICGIYPVLRDKDIRGDVTTYLSRNDALPNVQKSLFQLAAGVRYMHAENVCHGDLSGRNVLLDDEHNIKICDLGLGTWIKTTVAPLSQTEGGGTSYYMAPEIWALNYRTSTATVLDRAASDVYAFACLAFEMIFGKPPFRFDNPVQVSLKVTRGQRPSRPTAPVIEDQLWAVIEQCWAHDPNERPSMGNIVTRMEGWGWDAL